MSDRPWFRINRDLLVYKAFYFFFLSGFGSIFPYLPVYFRQIGLPASQVGLLLGLRPIVQFASAPFWAIMADKYRKRKSVLVMSVLSWLVMTMTLAFVEPTNEICEIRQGNDTHKHVVNYTKVKTGFFRRSLWQTEVGDKRAQQRNLDVVPIHVDHSTTRFKTLSSPSATLPSAFSKTSNPTQLQLGGKSKTISQERRIFLPSNISRISVLRTPSKEQKDTPYSSSIKTLSSNRKVSETLVTKDKEQRDRFKNKRGPRLKTKTNNTLHTATSKSSEQIKSKHLSRFYKTTNLPGENNRRNHFTKILSQKANRQHKLNSRKSGGKTAKAELPKIAGGNFTSNFASPARHTAKNDNSSIDKRRENKDSPPVVIEFSRIIIPHGIDKNTANSENKATEDTSGHIGGPFIAKNLTKFVSHGNVSQSKEPSITQVNPNMSDIFAHITRQPTDNIDKNNLLQLQEKLSKIIRIDNQKTVDKNSPLIAGKDEVHSQLHIIDASTESPVLSNQSLIHEPVVQVRVNSKNKTSFKDYDKLSQREELRKSKTQFVMHHGRTKPTLDSSALNETNDIKVADGQVSNSQGESDVFQFDDLLSGSGSTLFVPSVEQDTRDGARTFDDVPKEQSKMQANMEASGNFHKSNMQVYEETSKSKAMNNESYFVAGDEETTAGNFMQESSVTSTHLVGNSDSKLQIWMTNLLKTNPFELKRIFTILLVLVVVGEFLEAPSTTLADASLLEHLGEERRYYGKQRLWGSLGFGLSSFFVGVLLERSRHVVCGDQYTDYMICFCVFALLMVTTLFISTTFKFKYKETDSKHTSVFSALCNIHYGSCLAAACFMGVSHGMSHSFLNWFLEDLGATKTLMGVAVICRSSLDLLTFFVAGSLIKAVGQIKIMICALISYGIAFTLYSLLTNPWWVLPIEMLVGCTYAASWSACTSYMAGAASSESVTTIQGNNE